MHRLVLWNRTQHRKAPTGARARRGFERCHTRGNVPRCEAQVTSGDPCLRIGAELVRLPRAPELRDTALL